MPATSTAGSPCSSLGTSGSSRRGDEGEGEAELLGRVAHHVAEEAQELAAALGGVKHQARQHLGADAGAAGARAR